ncbi:uncharacterized protein V1516DRAFT_283847 [Lipomyces oligophaga]|uniref:uncharacterized protein n=1 Tax=Lipomyces oligophaga TaxID=45792 RepID=UPI0034CD7296
MVSSVKQSARIQNRAANTKNSNINNVNNSTARQRRSVTTRRRLDKEPRSRLGCLTCRSRHKRCDQREPFCRNCERLQVKCEGYKTRLRWQDRTMLFVDIPDTTYFALRFLTFNTTDYRDFPESVEALLNFYSPMDMVPIDSLTETPTGTTTPSNIEPQFETVTESRMSQKPGSLFLGPVEDNLAYGTIPTSVSSAGSNEDFFASDSSPSLEEEHLFLSTTSTPQSISQPGSGLSQYGALFYPPSEYPIDIQTSGHMNTFGPALQTDYGHPAAALDYFPFYHMEIPSMHSPAGPTQFELTSTTLELSESAPQRWNDQQLRA